MYHGRTQNAQQNQHSVHIILVIIYQQYTTYIRTRAGVYTDTHIQSGLYGHTQDPDSINTQHPPNSPALTHPFQAPPSPKSTQDAESTHRLQAQKAKESVKVVAANKGPAASKGGGGGGRGGGKGSKVAAGAKGEKGEKDGDKEEALKPKKARSAYNFYLLKRIAQVCGVGYCCQCVRGWCVRC